MAGKWLPDPSDHRERPATSLEPLLGAASWPWNDRRNRVQGFRIAACASAAACGRDNVNGRFGIGIACDPLLSFSPDGRMLAVGFRNEPQWANAEILIWMEILAVSAAAPN